LQLVYLIKHLYARRQRQQCFNSIADCAGGMKLLPALNRQEILKFVMPTVAYLREVD